MCGRFTQAYTWEQLVRLYRLTMPPQNTQPSYNVCPTDQVDVILPAEGGGYDYARMRWGLVPYWWSKPLKQVPATFNARSDTVATKPMFRDAFKRRRCVIPISGFYEWRQMQDGKQPFYISGVEAPVLSVAGLWDNWTNRDTGEAIRSCTMIVTEANPFMSEIHDRMPVFLGQERLDPWLLRQGGTEMLLPASAGHLQARPVSRRGSPQASRATRRGLSDLASISACRSHHAEVSDRLAPRKRRRWARAKDLSENDWPIWRCLLGSAHP